MHCHLIGACKIASIHGPMAAAFNKSSGSAKNVEALKNVIFGKKINYDCAFHPFNTIGSAEGKLIGGNLALLCNVIGTKSDFDCKNKILFIEDIGEYKYSIDRMLHQLKRSGKFDKLAGLIIGGFTDIKDTERPFGMETNAIIKELLKEYNYPICFEFPISHGKENLAVKIGMNYSFKVTKTKTSLKEI
jgi:muramoyltetrapeptide carboxypeptidase